jgi:hypothetical protein
VISEPKSEPVVVNAPWKRLKEGQQDESEKTSEEDEK